MSQILDTLKQVEHAEDQTLIGLNRLSPNIDAAVKLLQACRTADLGNDANAVLDELVVIAQKFQQIVGPRQ